MAVGRRGDKTYTAHGVQTDRLRALDKHRHTPAGMAGRVAAPSAEAIRGYLAAQLCPFCGEGPWKVVAIHTHGAHGVSAAELRELAGVIKAASICSPEISRTRAERMAGKSLPKSSKPPKPRVFSEAGRAVQAAKLDAVRTPDQQAAASRASGDAQLARNAEKHARAVELWTTTNRGLLDIAAEVGMHYRYVKTALARAGIDIGDGRTARWSRG